MARVLIFCCLVTLVTGCVIPHVETFHPIKEKSVNTALIDAQSGQPVKNASVILVLARVADRVPDAVISPRRPKIEVEKYENLAKLAYLEGGVWVWPVAFGTLYSDADILVYKKGYEPVPFKRLWAKEPNFHYYYPETLRMTPCDPELGKELAIKLAIEAIRNEEWKQYAKGVLEKKLR